MERIELVKSSAAAFAECGTLTKQAAEFIVAALLAADYSQYCAVRDAWIPEYRAQAAERGAPIDDAAGRKAWSRLLKAADVEIPKAETTEATTKQKQRAARAEKEKPADEAFQAMPAESLKAALEELGAQAAAGNEVAVKRIKAIQSEFARREKAIADAEGEATKKLRADVIARVKTATHEELVGILAVLSGEAEITPIATSNEEKPVRKLRKTA